MRAPVLRSQIYPPLKCHFGGYTPISKQTQRHPNSLSKCGGNLVAPSDSSRFFSKQLARFGDVFQNVLKHIQIGV